MRRLILPTIIMLAFPLSTITAQESKAVMTWHSNNRVAIKIAKVTGKHLWEAMPIAEAFNRNIVHYPHCTEDETLAMLFQESCFSPNEISNTNDYGIGQINYKHWLKGMGVSGEQALDLDTNMNISFSIWNSCNQNYGRYCGKKKNVKYYNKKLKIIKKLKEIKG